MWTSPKMKKIISFIAAVIFLAACEKDVPKPADRNYLTIGHETIVLRPTADILSNAATASISFYGIDQYDLRTNTGKQTTMLLNIDTLAAGTYTYRSLFADDYVKGKYFTGCNIVANVNYSLSVDTVWGGAVYTTPQSGTIVITDSPDGKVFKFDLKYDAVNVTGQFTGLLSD